jgi:hypothetical protein
MQRQLAVLPGGEAWLRPPSRNAWHSTHAFTIAEHTEAPLAEFSRRYPQPWPGICPNPQPAPQPPPPGEPHWIDATVIALVGLSAETYYHWLLAGNASPRMAGPRRADLAQRRVGALRT